MNALGGFLFGYGAGTVVTFFLIMLFAQVMEKKQKKFLIEKGRAKVKVK